MSYRLALSDDDVPPALRSCAAEQLVDAIRVLREEREADPVEAVHEARKDLKKARSLLRLAGPDMPGERRRHENGALRDIAQRLSDVRDADVMVETLDSLRERIAERLSARAFSTVRRRFATAAARSRAGDAAISEEVLAELGAVAARVGDWPVESCDARTLRAGARTASARGRRRFAAAEEDPTTENLHGWRKRVKDLWYHTRLLEQAWPPVMIASADAAHELADLLGDDHDLGVLAERLESATWPLSVDAGTLLDLVARRRGELQAEAFTLGRLVYAERPKAYGRRLGRYLRALPQPSAPELNPTA